MNFPLKVGKLPITLSNDERSAYWRAFADFAERTGAYQLAPDTDEEKEIIGNAKLWEREFDCKVILDEQGRWQNVVFPDEETKLAFLLLAAGWK